MKRPAITMYNWFRLIVNFSADKNMGCPVLIVCCCFVHRHWQLVYPKSHSDNTPGCFAWLLGLPCRPNLHCREHHWCRNLFLLTLTRNHKKRNGLLVERSNRHASCASWSHLSCTLWAGVAYSSLCWVPLPFCSCLLLLVVLLFIVVAVAVAVVVIVVVIVTTLQVAKYNEVSDLVVRRSVHY